VFQLRINYRSDTQRLLLAPLGTTQTAGSASTHTHK